MAKEPLLNHDYPIKIGASFYSSDAPPVHTLFSVFCTSAPVLTLSSVLSPVGGFGQVGLLSDRQFFLQLAIPKLYSKLGFSVLTHRELWQPLSQVQKRETMKETVF
jgi:hypothetical protein